MGSHCSHVPSQDNKITREMAPRSPALLLLATWLLVAVAGHYNPLVSVCPGEGSRYGDHKCIHDRTHRVCAKLVADQATCAPVRWPDVGSFWEMTGQTRWDWSQSICRGGNPGDSWCICMWAAASSSPASGGSVRRTRARGAGGTGCR